MPGFKIFKIISAGEAPRKGFGHLSSNNTARASEFMKSKISKTVLLFVLFWMAASNYPAQKPKRSLLPRVGLIKHDQKVSEGKEGCGNHIIFYPKVEGGAEIFSSDHEGFNAWMNFDGRNVELRLIKTMLYHHRDQFDADAFYEYRYKNISITVSLLQSFDYTFSSPAKIVVRKGREIRTMRAVVAPQCDAL